MEQDIQLWLKELRKQDGPKKDVNDEDAVKELRLSALDNILANLEPQSNLKGRQLSIHLNKLESIFKTAHDKMKSDFNKITGDGNNYIVLLFMILFQMMVEIIQDIKLENLTNEKLDVKEYIKNQINKLEGNNNNNKKRKIILDEVKTPDTKKPRIEDFIYEKESIYESSDDEKDLDEYDYTDGFLVRDDDMDEDDIEENDDEEEEEDESSDEEEKKTLDYYKEMIDKSDSNKDDKNIAKEFLDSINKLNTGNTNGMDETVKYFLKMNEENKKSLMDSINNINEKKDTEPLLIKLLNYETSDKNKNHILKQFWAVENSASDNGKLKNWLNNVMKIPFGVYKGKDLTDLKTNKKVKLFLRDLEKNMDEAVYGHRTAKRKIIQMMAQKIKNPESKGSVLGIYGIRGNGKTTLIKEGIAKAMNKPFVFISLGGASDASFLEGHSYTYEGSIYGRIANGIMEAGCMNPIIYFDELDKISKTHKGDEITNMLIHLMDPVQNSHFNDKYFFGLDIDLSRCTFIFSFNNPENVDPILLDRITCVQTKYLLPSQKLFIGENYLMKGILKDIGLKESDIIFDNNLINLIVNDYTREGGVRKLKSLLYEICREINIHQLTGKKLCKEVVKYPYKVNKKIVRKILKDNYRVSKETIHKLPKRGVVNGLYAGSLGMGGVLPIETLFYPSSKLLEIKATGSLQKVIKESIEVACSLAWNKIGVERQKLWLKEWKKYPQGFHIHCPEGAVPKDGPSAGAALTLVFYSMMMDKKINNEVAMTGEINLQGEVLKIGGLEEKLTGAKNAGIKKALVPRDNEEDLKKIKVRNETLLDDEFKVVIVDTIDDVIREALV